MGREDFLIRNGRADNGDYDIHPRWKYFGKYTGLYGEDLLLNQ